MAKTKDLTNWDDVDRTSLEAMSFQEMLDAGVVSIEEIDDVVSVDQEDLVGKTFILFDYDIKQSETFGGVYALCRVKTAEGTRIFADGGVGICEQLSRYEQIRNAKNLPKEPILFPKGLRKSEYTTQIPDEKKPGQTKSIPATTYYFDNDVSV